jgi:hypothetical protein
MQLQIHGEGSERVCGVLINVGGDRMMYVLCREMTDEAFAAYQKEVEANAATSRPGQELDFEEMQLENHPSRDTGR